MLRLFVIVNVFLGALPPLTIAEILASPSGAQYVIVFKTEDTMDYFIKECSGKGNRIFKDDCLSCVAATIQSGTPCSIIKKTLLTRKIRIIQGPHKGRVGWVPMEMIRD